MRLLPKTSGDWFEIFPLMLKAGVAISIPALFAYHRALALPGMYAVSVNREMKTLAQPIEIFCVVAGILLFIAGIIELFRHRRMKAASDFLFVALALLCFFLAESFTVFVK